MGIKDSSDAIRRLYLAATDPSQWEAALGLIAKITGFSSALLHHQTKTEPAQLRVYSFNSSESASQEFSRINDRLSQLRPLFDQAALCPAQSLNVARLSETEHSSIFHWAGAENCHHLAAVLTGPTGSKMRLDLERPYEAGPPGEQSLKALADILPDLSRAAELSSLVGQIESQRKLALQLLNAFSLGILVLNSSRDVIFKNAAAETILADADGITLSNERLSLARSSDDRRFSRLIAEAFQNAGSGAATSGFWMRLHRPSGRAGCALMIAPLVAAPFLGAFGQAAVLLSICDPQHSLEPDPTALQAVYGLTATEVALTAHLAKGLALQDAAHNLRITAGTARGYLKSIFRKTEVHRQLDLAILIHGLGTSTKLNPP